MSAKTDLLCWAIGMTIFVVLVLSWYAFILAN